MSVKSLEDLKKFSDNLKTFSPSYHHSGDDGEFIYFDAYTVDQIKKKENGKYRCYWIILAIFSIVAIIGAIIVYCDSPSYNFPIMISMICGVVSFDIIFYFIISALITLKASQAIQIRIYGEIAKLNYAASFLFKDDENNNTNNTSNKDDENNNTDDTDNNQNINIT